MGTGSRITLLACIGLTGCAQSCQDPASGKSVVIDVRDATALATVVLDAAAPRIQTCPGRRGTQLDSDGDGISDRVEANNLAMGHSSLDPMRCNPEDPSAALGRPYGGTLGDGVNMPDRADGFRHFLGSDAVDTDDWATLAMVQCLEAVGQGMAKRGREIGVTDLSRARGGRFAPHKSHQNGVDADMRYQRKDAKNWPLDLKRHIEEYDPAQTLAMFKLFAAHCPVEVVFADLDRIGFEPEQVPGLRLAHVNGHSNHLHLRLKGKVAP